MRDLFISSYAPTLESGRAQRTYTCVRALAKLGPVDLAYVPHQGRGPSPEYQAIENLDFHEIVPSRGLRRAVTYGGKRLTGAPDQYVRGVSPELIEYGRRIAAELGRRRVVIGDMTTAVALLPIATRRPLIYNAHNVESSYRQEGHGKRIWNHLAIRRLERRLLRLASESWMVSRADVATAAALVPRARLRYVPNVVDSEAIRPREATIAPGHTVTMIGDFSYPPNRSGVAFLIDEVMPRLWEALPDARLRLVGRALDEDIATDPRIEVVGFVPNIADAYADADCVAVPLVEGAGTPLKFVEALAYGMPIVATPLAAKGLEVVAGEHYLDGATSAAFAAGVVQVLRDGAGEMGARARQLAEREYSISALADRIAT